MVPGWLLELRGPHIEISCTTVNTNIWVTVKALASSACRSQYLDCFSFLKAYVQRLSVIMSKYFNCCWRTTYLVEIHRKAGVIAPLFG